MLTLPTEPLIYANFAVRYLLQPVDAIDGSLRGMTETELPLGGDHWFWADDNAKLLEFLALPEVWRRHPEAVQQTFGFLRGLCDGPFILRRRGRARLERRSAEDTGVGFTHTFMDIGGNLALGVVEVGMRFHDPRTARNVILTGNYIRFTFDETQYVLDVEEAIVGHDIQHAGLDLTLSHRSALRFTHRGSEHQLGSLAYSYRFSGRSMFFDVDVVLELNPDLEISDVVLTVAHDDLSHGGNGVHYSNILYETTAGESGRASATVAGHHPVAAPALRYWAMAQREEMRGFALAIHTMPREPHRVGLLNSFIQQPGRLHYVIGEHAFPGLHQGGRLTANERKIITSGGFYDRVAQTSELMRRHADAAEAGRNPIDLSISYDYGAELNAFARCVRAATMPDGPATLPVIAAEARQAFDHYLAVYSENMIEAHKSDPGTIFSRPLSFAILGLVDMLLAGDGRGAGGEARYRDTLWEFCNVLLEFEQPFQRVDGTFASGFLMGLRNNAEPSSDCHSAAILALVRASAVLDDARFPPAIDRALAAFRLDTVDYEFAIPRLQDLVGVDFVPPGRQRRTLPLYWNFCAGLALRAFKAGRNSPVPTIRTVFERHAGRLAIFEAVLRHQLQRSVTCREASLELRTAVIAPESNSETQPWVALGLIDDSGDS